MEELSYSDWNLKYGSEMEIKQVTVYEGRRLKMTDDKRLSPRAAILVGGIFLLAFWTGLWILVARLL